jgi:ribosomal-protein-alanine N-acetyltransferase
VAEDRPGALLGYVGVELSALGGEADVINLAVDPAHRRHGIGRRLLRAAVAYCRRRRIPLVWLRVRASNRSARAFYRRCGFAVVGRFRGYYEEPREDAVLMRAENARLRTSRGWSPAVRGARTPKIRRRPASRKRR